MKKSLMLANVLILICGMVGAANAAPYDYSDLIDYWNFSGTSYGEYQDDSHYSDSVSLSENDALSYTHNLNDDVNFAGGDLVTSASLELDFTNDLLDVVFTGWLAWLPNTTEHISYAFDGTGWTYLDEVDNGQYTVGVDIALINGQWPFKCRACRVKLGQRKYRRVAGPFPPFWYGRHIRH